MSELMTLLEAYYYYQCSKGMGFFCSTPKRESKTDLGSSSCILILNINMKYLI